MQWYQLRPTFEILVSDSRQSVMEKLEQEYVRLRKPPSFFLHGEYGELHLPPAEHRVWSPHLSFYVTADSDQSLIRGRFAPRVEVWTLVWIVYLAMAFTLFFSLIMAYGQWMLGTTVWAGAVACIAIVIMVALFGIAHIGQQLSSDQMKELREQLEGILNTAGIIRPHP